MDFKSNTLPTEPHELPLIKYSFPLDFDRNSDINCEKINHKSAIEYPEHVTAYLQEELDNKAMLGPFKTPPIDNLHVSPFMTRDKSSSVNRRVIIDLSWPFGHSVNSGVGSDCYLGTEFVLTYPSIDNITSEVLKLGKGCKIFKIDISRVFCHVQIDDLDLLGLSWEDYFLNQLLPFGFKHGSSIFQRLSKVKVGVLRPVQQPGSYWDRSSELPLVGLEPTEVTAYDYMPNLLTTRPLRTSRDSQTW